jgi:hypothetical protein
MIKPSKTTSPGPTAIYFQLLPQTFSLLLSVTTMFFFFIYSYVLFLLLLLFIIFLISLFSSYCSILLSTYLPNFFPTFSFWNLFTVEETIAWGVSTNDTILKIWFRNFFNKFYFWKLLYCFLWQIFISRPIICSLSSTYE